MRERDSLHIRIKWNKYTWATPGPRDFLFCFVFYTFFFFYYSVLSFRSPFCHRTEMFRYLPLPPYIVCVRVSECWCVCIFARVETLLFEITLRPWLRPLGSTRTVFACEWGECFCTHFIWTFRWSALCGRGAFNGLKEFRNRVSGNIMFRL